MYCNGATPHYLTIAALDYPYQPWVALQLVKGEEVRISFRTQSDFSFHRT